MWPLSSSLNALILAYRQAVAEAERALDAEAKALQALQIAELYANEARGQVAVAHAAMIVGIKAEKIQ
jgi:hypothetical protein